jgi:Spy/CpxP family protein refolding chaperone
MRSLKLSVLGLLWLVCAPALAQMGPGHGPGPGGPPPAGPKEGRGKMMMGGGMGGMDMDEGCDPASCPMMQGHGDDHPGMHLRMLEHVVDDLGLSEAARKNVRDAIYEATKQAITLGAELAQTGLELRRLMEQDKPDVEAVLKQVEKIGQLRTELMKLHVRTVLKIEQLLTPDQRKKLRGRMHGMPGMHGHHHE